MITKIDDALPVYQVSKIEERVQGAELLTSSVFPIERALFVMHDTPP